MKSNDVPSSRKESFHREGKYMYTYIYIFLFFRNSYSREGKNRIVFEISPFEIIVEIISMPLDNSREWTMRMNFVTKLYD